MKVSSTIRRGWSPVLTEAVPQSVVTTGGLTVPSEYGVVRVLYKQDDIGEDYELVVGGYASPQIIDREKHLITKEAMVADLPRFLAHPHYRNAMIVHSNIQVGEVLPRYENPNTGEVWETKVDDIGLFCVIKMRTDKYRPEICEKVEADIREGKLASFSISGDAPFDSRRHTCHDGTCFWIIDKIIFYEVTICEVGVNQDAKFSILSKSAFCEDGVCPIVLPGRLDKSTLRKAHATHVHKQTGTPQTPTEMKPETAQDPRSADIAGPKATGTGSVPSGTRKHRDSQGSTEHHRRGSQGYDQRHALEHPEETDEAQGVRQQPDPWEDQAEPQYGFRNPDISKPWRRGAMTGVEKDAFAEGLAIETSEHPEVDQATAEQLVRDHLAEDPEYYATEEKAGGGVGGGHHVQVRDPMTPGRGDGGLMVDRHYGDDEQQVREARLSPNLVSQPVAGPLEQKCQHGILLRGDQTFGPQEVGYGEAEIEEAVEEKHLTPKPHAHQGGNQASGKPMPVVGSAEGPKGTQTLRRPKPIKPPGPMIKGGYLPPHGSLGSDDDVNRESEEYYLNKNCPFCKAQAVIEATLDNRELYSAMSPQFRGILRHSLATLQEGMGGMDYSRGNGWIVLADDHARMGFTEPGVGIPLTTLMEAVGATAFDRGMTGLVGGAVDADSRLVKMEPLGSHEASVEFKAILAKLEEMGLPVKDMIAKYGAGGGYTVGWLGDAQRTVTAASEALGGVSREDLSDDLGVALDSIANDLQHLSASLGVTEELKGIVGVERPNLDVVREVAKDTEQDVEAADSVLEAVDPDLEKERSTERFERDDDAQVIRPDDAAVKVGAPAGVPTDNPNASVVSRAVVNRPQIQKQTGQDADLWGAANRGAGRRALGPTTEELDTLDSGQHPVYDYNRSLREDVPIDKAEVDPLDAPNRGVATEEPNSDAAVDYPLGPHAPRETAEDIEKHPGHDDQSVHGKGGGKGKKNTAAAFGLKFPDPRQGPAFDRAMAYYERDGGNPERWVKYFKRALSGDPEYRLSRVWDNFNQDRVRQNEFAVRQGGVGGKAYVPPDWKPPQDVKKHPGHDDQSVHGGGGEEETRTERIERKYRMQVVDELMTMPGARKLSGEKVREVAIWLIKEYGTQIPLSGARRALGEASVDKDTGARQDRFIGDPSRIRNGPEIDHPMRVEGAGMPKPGGEFEDQGPEGRTEHPQPIREREFDSRGAVRDEKHSVPILKMGNHDAEALFKLHSSMWSRYVTDKALTLAVIRLDDDGNVEIIDVAGR